MDLKFFFYPAQNCPGTNLCFPAADTAAATPLTLGISLNVANFSCISINRLMI